MSLNNYFVWGPGEAIPRWIGPWWMLGLALVIFAVVMLVGTYLAGKYVAARNRSRNRLRRVWKTFLRNIPSEFRRYILLYQPFVVFGESGSGKSSLIGRYTDWKGQAAQFYPSYNADPSLQIYLGSRALVQELPSTLLADTQPASRRALVRLWKPLFGSRDPIAVLTVSAAALRKATPESIRSQAQILRGKINILSDLTNKPVRARIVLTHMDQVEGYLAYSQFVEKNGVPHQLQLDPKAPDGNLAHCLEPQEKYLPLALTSLSAQNYLKVLTFLNKAPSTFENLGALLRALKEPDPLSFEPRVEDLYLTSDQGGSPSAISNPFAAAWTDQRVAMEKAQVRFHRRITRAATAVGLVYFAFAFFYERHQINAAGAAVTDLETAPLKDRPAMDAADKIHVLEGAQSSILNALLPNFFRGTSATLRARYVKTIRQSYLMPLFRELNGRQVDVPEEFALFLTGLTYASANNELGRLILKQGETEEARLREVAHALVVNRIERVPPPIIKAYIELSDEPYAGKYDELPMSLPHLSQVWHGITDKQNWDKLVSSIAKEIQRNKVTPNSLAVLKKDSQVFKDDLAAIRRRDTGQQIFAILKTDPRFRVELFEKYISEVTLPTWLRRQERSLEGVLDLVLDKRSTLDYEAPPSSAPPLQNLNDEIDAIRREKVEPRPALSIRFNDEPSGHPVEISRTAWDQMINDGRVETAVDRFIHAYGEARSKIFFAKVAEKTWDRPIVMKPGTASDYAFKGQIVVPSEYTRRYYDREIRDRLDTFDKTFDVATVTKDVRIPAEQGVAPVDTSEPTLPPLKLDEDLRNKLDELVQNAASEYATNYATWWRRFYDEWSVRADDVNTARAIFSQMALGSSRFQEFLLKIRENTTFEASESKTLNAMFEKLGDFQKINRLQDTERGQNPEIDKYRTILRGIVADLDGKPADKSKDAVGPTEMRRAPLAFETLLSPAGRISFAILRGTRDSKIVTVEEWLKANGIDAEWRRPFLEPVEQLHKLGTDDIVAFVRRSWKDRVLSQVEPLLDKFPFNKNAISDATPEYVEEVLLPKTGLFWVAWRNLIAPVCDEGPLGWKPARDLEALNNDPKGMFDVVSALARISDKLWNKDSVPRPLKFEIDPQTLPVSTNNKPAIITSFLESGRSSVFGFNQKNYTQTLSIEWWDRPPASVGMQVGDPASNAKSFRSINEPQSAWSFYRLLLRDRHAEQKIWVFDMTQGEPEYPVPLLKFQFHEDPWLVFAVPGYERPQQPKEDTK